MNEFLVQLLDLAHKNKYAKWYSSIITRAKENEQFFVGYGENHHILPKSFKLGGEKDKSNIVKLTAREHFICHALLVKMLSGKYLYKMARALLGMKRDPCGNRYFNARLYALKRGKMNHTEETKQKMSVARTGTKASEKTKGVMSASKIIYWADEDKRQVMSDKLTDVYANPDLRQKISSSVKKALEKPTVRKKISDASNKSWADPNYRDKHAKSMKAVMETDEYKSNMSVAVKASIGAEEKAARSKRLKDMWADPEKKAAMLAKRKKAPSLLSVCSS